jgi:hypothetical protein
MSVEPNRRTRRERLRCDYDRFGYGWRDVADAAEAARALWDDGLNDAVRRVVETGLVVSYARPFTRGQSIGKRWVPREVHGLHDELCALRHKVHAHTDPRAERHSHIDVGPELGVPAGIHLAPARYQYEIFTPAKLPATAASLERIAEALRKHHRELVSELNELGAAE